MLAKNRREVLGRRKKQAVGNGGDVLGRLRQPLARVLDPQAQCVFVERASGLLFESGVQGRRGQLYRSRERGLVHILLVPVPFKPLNRFAHGPRNDRRLPGGGGVTVVVAQDREQQDVQEGTRGQNSIGGVAMAMLLQ